MLQPSVQQAGRCDGCWSPAGSWVAPSRVQMTLPKASSCAVSGPMLKANAPSVDWSNSKQAATSATGMLQRLSRRFTICLFKRSMTIPTTAARGRKSAIPCCGNTAGSVLLGWPAFRDGGQQCLARRLQVLAAGGIDLAEIARLERLDIG